MVAGSVLTELKAVDALKEGRTTAPDRPKRHAVPQADINAVRAVVRQRTRDIIDLLLATRARRGEILMLTTGMLDRTGDVWKAELRDHKMVHKGRVRVLYFGMAAQEILARYIKADPDVRLFPVRRTSFGHTIGNACIRSGVQRFTPHATRVRDAHGIEAAQAMLGHAKPDMTAKYSTDQEKRILELVKKIGRRRITPGDRTAIRKAEHLDQLPPAYVSRPGREPERRKCRHARSLIRRGMLQSA